eukprot:GGOE01061933.1.p1 GENE.GGOE01061933.1~~GGOE01061933.1.p1  ORF type:complete len:482 (+),score=104.87 GGOE01061933.1:31-1446(+)
MATALPLLCIVSFLLPGVCHLHPGHRPAVLAALTPHFRLQRLGCPPRFTTGRPQFSGRGRALPPVSTRATHHAGYTVGAPGRPTERGRALQGMVISCGLLLAMLAWVLRRKQHAAPQQPPFCMTSVDASTPAADTLPRDDPPHSPVLLREVLEYLRVLDGAHYLDCTFGAGGYSRAILSAANCNVTALDQDPNVLPYASAVQAEFGSRFTFLRTNFAQAGKATGRRRFDGVVVDLGVSSMQLDEAARGFSIKGDGPLDMRMSREGLTAVDFVNTAPEMEIADVLWKFGEERCSRQIASAIVRRRATEPIQTTAQLADVVRGAIRRKQLRDTGRTRKLSIDPATKTFMAIRIHINRELECLSLLLGQARDLLAPGGRLVIVSFHSLEDRCVKNFFTTHSPPIIAVSKYRPQVIPRTAEQFLTVLTRKPVTPSDEEVDRNQRCRSAKLRAAEMHDVAGEAGGPPAARSASGHH